LKGVCHFLRHPACSSRPEIGMRLSRSSSLKFTVASIFGRMKGWDHEDKPLRNTKGKRPSRNSSLLIKDIQIWMSIFQMWYITNANVSGPAPSEHKTGCVKRTPVKPVGMVFEDFDVTNSISSEYIAAALRLKLLLSRWSIFFCMSLFSHPPKTVFNG
jgi:hypothetical protein